MMKELAGQEVEWEKEKNDTGRGKGNSAVRGARWSSRKEKNKLNGYKGPDGKAKKSSSRGKEWQHSKKKMWPNRAKDGGPGTVKGEKTGSRSEQKKKNE